MKRLVATGLIAALLVTVLVKLALATPTGERNFSVGWWAVGGGGGQTSGGTFSLQGTVGQPEAGGLSGGTFTMTGGFQSGIERSYRVYLPTVLKNY